MLSILMALAATQAQPAATTPPAAPARTLQSVPGVTVKYYVVAGRIASCENMTDPSAFTGSSFQPFAKYARV